MDYPDHNMMPPDELNKAQNSTDGDFGFPYCYGKTTFDPEFNINKSCVPYVPAILELEPHVAPLGIRFYTGKSFPAKYNNIIFIAEHGSIFKSPPSGYKVGMVTRSLNEKNEYSINYKQFITLVLPVFNQYHC